MAFLCIILIIPLGSGHMLPDSSHYKLFKMRRHISRSSSSIKCFQLAKKWFHDCKTNHPQCTQESSPLPSRIILIHGDSTPPALKLIKPTLDMKASYVALSYRWFAESTLKLTISNEQALQKEIPWSAIPPTFRDTVAICKSLGLRYLWIDSLCILQDSSMDWDRESSCMKDVYRNASLVIGASQLVGTSADIGFLGRREGHLIEHVGKLSTPQNKVLLDIFIMPYQPHHGASKIQDPLSQRGWTYQERLLARRFLLFKPDEMLWQCEICEKCECTTLDRCTYEKDREHHYSLQSMLSYDKEEVYHAWTHKIISNYSKRVLTYESDKLPALAGAAQFFHEKLQDEYLAGLWKGDFLSGLRWEPDSFTIKNQHPASYRAPSWSWVSTNLGVNYPDSKFFKEFAEIIDVKCDTADGLPFGRVTGGYLTLKAPIVEGWIRFPQSGIMQNARNTTLITVRPGRINDYWIFWPDSTLSTGVKLGTSSSNSVVGVQRVNFEDSVPDYDKRTASVDVRVWCLCIGLQENSPGGYREVVALVLSRSPQNIKHFIRLGLIKQVVLTTEQPFVSAEWETVTII
jgi:hypothetical protein